jgi:hypothetical protein
MSPRPLCAVSRPSALDKGALLTKASPVLQFDPAAMLATEGAIVASVARPTERAPAPPLPVIKSIVRNTMVDPDETAPRASHTPPAHRYGAIVLAAVFAAALGALAGISMRAITPAAAPQAAVGHGAEPPALSR